MFTCLEWDSNLSPKWLAVFEDCKATALTTQPLQLDRIELLIMLIPPLRKKLSFTYFERPKLLTKCVLKFFIILLIRRVIIAFNC